MTELTVICARPDGQNEASGPPISPVLDAVAAFTDRIVFAGRFPGKDLDPELTDRIAVIGEESALAAVLVRLLRLGRLGSPQSGPPEYPTTIGYIPLQRNEFSTRWKLRTGPAAVSTACTGASHPIPLVRDDSGGVLVGTATVEQPMATVYVDENRLLQGSADRLVVRPGIADGVDVSVELRRPFGLPPRRRTGHGRAVSVGFREPTVVTVDGIARPRPLPRVTWYAHTEPLYLAR